MYEQNSRSKEHTNHSVFAATVMKKPFGSVMHWQCEVDKLLKLCDLGPSCVKWRFQVIE